jgi:carbon monoxide dehydrogenase subunit G
MRVEATTVIDAPWQRVAAIYGDWRAWASLFPTIHGVTLVSEKDGTVVLDIDHDEGHVPNVLTWVAPDRARLEERKHRFDATFVNSFEPAGGGTRYRVEADIRFRGIARLLAPLLRGVVKRRIEKFVLSPVKQQAERESRS